jgi:hypothetical protein
LTAIALEIDDLAAANRARASICTAANQRHLRTAVLPRELDSRFRVACF